MAPGPGRRDLRTLESEVSHDGWVVGALSSASSAGDRTPDRVVAGPSAGPNAGGARAEAASPAPAAEAADGERYPISRVGSRKSVTFGPLDDPDHQDTTMDRHRQLNTRRDSTGESSADETTAIVGKERGPAAGKDYKSGANASGSSSGPGSQANQRRRSGTPNGSQRQAQQNEEDKHTESWWRRAVDKYGSVELENKGSVARDHLALERTFLAWLRTSLSFASIGIAITQLFRLNTSILKDNSDIAASPAAHLRHVGKPLGATFIGISIAILFIGFHRYFESQHYVIRGKFPASRGSIVLVALITGALIVASLVVVLAIGGKSFEK